MHEAKGAIINNYGSKGWELVSTKYGEDNENEYIFKKKKQNTNFVAWVASRMTHAKRIPILIPFVWVFR